MVSVKKFKWLIKQTPSSYGFEFFVEVRPDFWYNEFARKKTKEAFPCLLAEQKGIRRGRIVVL